MRKSCFCLLFLLNTAILLFPPGAYADGGVWRRDSLSSYPLQQKEQMAAIFHRDGIQKMIIAINFELEDRSGAVWIFPVPGTPDRVSVDVADSFPDFRGRDILRVVRGGIWPYMTAVRATQIYFFEAVIMPNLIRYGAGPSRGASVHTRTEKWGIRAETVTATSEEELAAYLRDKKAGIPAEKLKVFRPYLSKRYVLVVTQISSHEELRRKFPGYENDEARPRGTRRPCLYVRFPTDRAFYPMYPTEALHPGTSVRLFVIGYAGFENPGLAAYSRLKYYQQDTFSDDDPEIFTQGLPSERIPYTAIRFSGIPEDIRLTPVRPPAEIRYAALLYGISDEIFPLDIFLTIAILSYISAGLAGLILARRWKGYACLGLWNLLTIIALWHAAGRKGAKRYFTCLFSLIFIAVTVILQILVSLLLAPS